MTWLRLLDELLRRARPPAASRVAERWTAWARRLMEGRARADAAGVGLPMRLAVPQGPARAADRGSWVGHRMQLAVRVLHTHAAAAANAGPGRSSAPSGASSGGTGPPTDRATGSELAVLARGGVAPAVPARGRVAPAAPPRPQLVLRAAAALLPGALRDAAPQQAPAVAVAASDVTVRRLVEQRRRVEEPSRRGRASMAAPLRASGDTADAAGTAGVDPQTGWALPVAGGSPPLVVRANAAVGADAPAADARDATAAHRPADAGTPAPVDIERLADQVVGQIDRRIVAHRERLGRI